MRVLVFGTGAVGGYLGAHLADGGHEVVFLARPATAQALTNQGLTLTGAARTLHVKEPLAVSDLDAALALGAPELILLTVKAYDARQAAEQIAAATANIPVVSFLNGVGSEELLSQALAPARVLAGTVTTAVQRESKSSVAVRRSRGVGLAADHPQAGPLARTLREAGLNVRLYPQRAGLKWSKLLTNLLANAASAVTGLAPARVYAHQGLYRLEIECLREALGALRAMDVPVYNLPGAPARWLGRAARLPAWLTRPLLRWKVGGARGEKMPSLYHDVERGRTEIAWLNGAVVGACDRLGRPAPANRLLTQAVHSLAKDPGTVPENRLSPDQLLAHAVEIGVPGLRGYNRAGPGADSAS